jgi:hypothetical protein
MKEGSEGNMQSELKPLYTGKGPCSALTRYFVIAGDKYKVCRGSAARLRAGGPVVIRKTRETDWWRQFISPLTVFGSCSWERWVSQRNAIVGCPPRLTPGQLELVAVPAKRAPNNKLALGEASVGHRDDGSSPLSLMRPGGL